MPEMDARIERDLGRFLAIPRPRFAGFVSSGCEDRESERGQSDEKVFHEEEWRGRDLDDSTSMRRAV
jgi:hypothetical protein